MNSVGNGPRLKAVFTTAPNGIPSGLVGEEAIVTTSVAGGGFVVSVPGTSGRTQATFPLFSEIVAPGPQVDVNGNIQFIALKGYDTSIPGFPVYHVMRQNGIWTQTLLDTVLLYRSSASTGLTWMVDPNGACHLVWLRLPNISSFKPAMEWCSNVTGSWVTSVVPTTGYSNLFPFDFDVSMSGELAIAIADQSVRIVQKPFPGGPWTSQTAPAEATAFWYDPLAIRLTNNGMALFFENTNSSTGTFTYYEKAMIGFGISWYPSTLLGTHLHNGSSTLTTAAKSPNGLRLAYIANLQEKGFSLFFREGNGPFTETQLGTNELDSYSLPVLGFTSANKVYIIFTTYGGGEGMETLILTEP
jgi:hypothetical protein